MQRINVHRLVFRSHGSRSKLHRAALRKSKLWQKLSGYEIISVLSWFGFDHFRVSCQRHTWRPTASHSWTKPRMMSLAARSWLKRSCVASQVGVWTLPKPDATHKCPHSSHHWCGCLLCYRGRILWETCRLNRSRDLWTWRREEGAAAPAGRRSGTGA